MYAIIRPFLQLTLLQIGPQDLPASRTLLLIAAGAYAVVGTLVGLSFYAPPSAVAQTLAELGVMALVVHLALYLRGHPERFMQTYTGLAGISAVLGTVALPLVHTVARGVPPSGETPVLAGLAYLLVLGWLLAAYGNVLRHALSLQRLSFGVVLAMLYLVFTTALTEILLGAGLMS
ncbi:hypothetical protein B1C78_15325 [Thioalkalivibrio denitrificans]|uniref:Yip1 domain-containing protein n=1 Tax=Thioalkalivibrio denitrificans TaxID=108003 RepID=A0A1V3NBT6_9GAMM|nr:hypothetical protein [Thioalkalivibrio denitrificans]OOG22312.1 hypothetical protein B1C78_15325 [Thioalkalivibrio denitrificans]